MSRRRFIDMLLAGQFLALAAAILYPIVAYLFPGAAAEAEPAELALGPETQLPPGGSKIVKLGSRPVLVLRTPEGKLRAVSAKCTHLNCTVQYKKEQSAIWCACHDGMYDLEGKNVSGPPPRPLEPLTVEVRDGDLYLKRA